MLRFELQTLLSDVTLCLCFAGTSAIVNPIGPTITSEYSECLLCFVEDNFEEAGLLVVANTFQVRLSPVAAIRTVLLREVQRGATHVVQVVSPDEHEIDAEHDVPELNSLHDLHYRHIDDYEAIPLADYYVVVVGGLTQFKQIVMKLSTLRSWNPRALFVVMCFKFYGPGENIESYPELMLTHLFLLNVVNAVIMVPDAQDRRKIKVYGWKPFDPPKYCGYRNESAAGRLIVENECDRGVTRHHEKVFEGKIPLSMNGCRLEVIALVRRPFVNEEHAVIPGIERILIDELALSMRFDIRYTTVQTQRGEKNSSNEWTGALGQLKAGRGDMVFGAVFPDNDVHEDFEASISYFSDSYAWVVPRAEPSPAWIALVIIFDVYVWMAAVGAYVLCVCAWRTFAQWSDESPYHRSLGHCALNVWYTTLGFCAYMRPLGHSLRIFFIFFTIYCVLFLTAYQTKLIDVLTNPSFEDQLSTPEELVSSSLLWGGLEELQDLFDDAEDALDNAIGAGYVDVDDEIAALTDVVVYKNFSLLCSRLAALDASARSEHLSDDDGQPKFYIFEENVFSIPVEFITLHGFPFMDRLNYLLAAFKQMGLMNRIRDMYEARTAWLRARLLEETAPLHAGHDGDTVGGRPLSLEHLQGGFLVLAVGYIGGTFVFGLELLSACDWYKNMRSKFVEFFKKRQTKKLI